jgi:predicted DNA repair protein MutK
MASSLLVLIDDIASLLDDVALLTKVAATKVTGVMGDDLALNAEQVAGVRVDRELPVVWAVAKGSFINKLILVPTALAISAFAPQAILPLLMIGGLFLCFEGVEKLLHKVLHKQEEPAHGELSRVLSPPDVDLVAYEKDKVKGAIRTDFVLSAEIVVITLGTVAGEPLVRQVTVLSLIGLAATVFVYGLVAGIVKIDDLGLRLTRTTGDGGTVGLRHRIGTGLLRLAPVMMKTLSVVGTAAMFTVGGSIIVHGLPPIAHPLESVAERVGEISGILATIVSTILDAVVGVVAGAVVLGVVEGGKRLWRMIRGGDR